MIKHNCIVLLAIFLMAGCSDNAPKTEVAGKNVHAADPFPTPQLIDSVFRIKDSNIIASSGAKDRCVEWQRQILIVKSYSSVHGNFVRKTNSKPEGASYIILEGEKSPSSCDLLKKAYIEFIPRDQPLRKPQFIIRNGSAEIRLFYSEDRMAEIQHTLSSTNNLYCWIGLFADGHVWGDIHASSIPLKW